VNEPALKDKVTLEKKQVLPLKPAASDIKKYETKENLDRNKKPV